MEVLGDCSPSVTEENVLSVITFGTWMFISKLVLGFSLVNDVDRNSNFKGRIIYTPMHGVGATYIDRAFQVAGFLPVVHVKEQKGPILLGFSLTTLFIAWKLSIIIYDKAGKVWRNAFGNLAAVYCSMQVYSCRI